MRTKVTTCAIAAVGVVLIAGPGDALAPAAPGVCYPALLEAPEAEAADPGRLAEAADAGRLDAAQQKLAGFLARRYYVALSQTERFVAAAYRAAAEVGLDPLLVLAVISVESRFNPIAQSGMGAKGLMQIIPKYHHAKLAPYGGEEAVLDPESNIEVGTRILHEYIRRTGTLQAGLQFYNGALWDESARYTRKVMAEHARLQEVVRSVSVGSA